MDAFEKSLTTILSESETGGFTGYASRFLSLDRQGDIVLPGAFTKALPSFMADGGLVLSDHDNRTGAVIGTLIDAREDQRGLLVDVKFSATKAGQEVRKLMAEKALRKMSIAFYAKAQRMTEKQVLGVWANYNYTPGPIQKSRIKDGARIIGQVEEIVEVSVVPIPANPEAEILAVKSFDGEIETPLVVAPRIDLAALARRANLADRVTGR
jgi:HK97 family phage prohead protease